MNTLEVMDGLAALPDAATIPLLAALQQAADGDIEAAAEMLDCAAQNARLELDKPEFGDTEVDA